MPGVARPAGVFHAWNQSRNRAKVYTTPSSHPARSKDRSKNVATSLLRIGDEIVVQIDTPEDLARPIAYGGAIPAGTVAITKLAALLDELCRPFREFFDKAGDLIVE